MPLFSRRTPCPNNLRGRITVSVIRDDPSKEHGTVHKKQNGLRIDLLENGTSIAHSTSSKYTADTSFDFRINTTATYSIKLTGDNTWDIVTGNTGGGNDGTLVAPAFPVGLVNVARVGTNNRRVSRVQFHIDRTVKRLAYRQIMRLPTEAELETHFFPDAVNTTAGKKQRLQLMGFYNRPLNYNFGRRTGLYTNHLSDYTNASQNVIRTDVIAKYTEAECLTTAIRYYRKVHGLRNDADITETLNKHVLEFWVQKSKTNTDRGVLPTDTEFARLMFPGGYNVFWPKGSLEWENHLLGSGGDNRYDVEHAFKEANPLLGKIPFVVEVERKEGGEDTWTPLATVPNERYEEVDLKISLIQPGVPQSGTFCASSSLEQAAQTYLDTRVNAYASGLQTDPLVGNVHWHLGGKRLMSNDGSLHSGAAYTGGRRSAILPLTLNTAHLGASYIRPDALIPNEEASFKTSLHITVPRDGKAFFVIDPSTIGGDRYKIQSEIGPETLEAFGNGAANVVKSGTFVVWRNIRILHQIRTPNISALNQLDSTLQADLKPGVWPCLHNPHLSGRLCLECLQREGSDDEYQWIDFTQEARTQFAKAYCELELAPELESGNYESMSDAHIKSALEKALDIVQGNTTINRFDGNNIAPIEIAMSDGETKDFGTRKVATSFKKGSVKLMYLKPNQLEGNRWEFLALNNSIANTCGALPTVDPTAFTYNSETKEVEIVFAEEIDTSWNFEIATEDKKGNFVRIEMDSSNWENDRKTFKQTLDKDLFPFFRLKVEGKIVANGAGDSYSKAKFDLTSCLGVDGCLKGTNALYTEPKATTVELSTKTQILDGMQLKIYGNGDESGDGDWVNGQVLMDENTPFGSTWHTIVIEGDCHPANTILKIEDEVVAKVEDKKFVLQGRFDPKNVNQEEHTNSSTIPEILPITLKGGGDLKIGNLPSIEITFGESLDRDKNITLLGGGTSPEDPFLQTHTIAAKMGNRKLTVELPKPCARYKTQLKFENTLICDGSHKILTETVTEPHITLTEGAVDNDNGTVKMVFDGNLAKGTRLGVAFVCEEFLQLRKLFYSPTNDRKSPFIFNMRTPWGYNASKDNRFGPLPAVGVKKEKFESDSNAAVQEFRLDLDSRNGAMRVDVNEDIWFYPGNNMGGGTSGARGKQAITNGDSINCSGGKKLKLNFSNEFTENPVIDAYYQYKDTANLLRQDWSSFKEEDGQLAIHGELVGKVEKILPKILTEFFRQIHGNQSFIPGLIFVQSPFFDTWSYTYSGGSQVGLAQGPGSFLTGSRMFDNENTYPHKNLCGDNVQSGTVQKIGIHEIAHSLFYQHAGAAGGAKPEEHDLNQTCIMSYSNSMKFFCGQCVAGLMGMNFKDGRFITERSTSPKTKEPVPYEGVSHWTSQPVVG